MESVYGQVQVKSSQVRLPQVQVTFDITSTIAIAINNIDPETKTVTATGTVTHGTVG